jgi:hypothetical protein
MVEKCVKLTLWFLFHAFSSRSNISFSRLGGVVVSMLATGHTGRGFKLGRGDGFFFS